MAEEDEPPSRPELVVLVHGTKSAYVAAEEGALRWWQPGSEFCRTLEWEFRNAREYRELEAGEDNDEDWPSSGAIPEDPADKPNLLEFESFEWSGRNLESHRRAAGRALFDRLRVLEREGRPYHLIGHSHGGSAIWHALVRSAGKKRKLEHLKSWSSVGTPFLTFEAKLAPLWRWISAAFLVGLCVWLLTIDAPQEWIKIVRQRWFDQEYARLAQLGFFYGLLGLLTLWAVARVVLSAVVRLIACREYGWYERAAAWYGDSWYALWHPDDEPINALAGSVGVAPEITPRISREGVLRFLPPIRWIYNGLFAHAADQFAWRQITANAQGSNRPHRSLTSVGRAPWWLEPGYTSLPHKMADEIAMRVEGPGYRALKEIRVALRHVYDTQGANDLFQSLRTVVSFDSIIHTSYFSHSGVAMLLGRWIDRKRDGGDSDGHLVGPKRRKEGSSQSPRYAPRRALEFILAMVLFIAPGTLLAFGALQAYVTVVTPTTVSYAVNQIKDLILTPRFLSAGDGSQLAEVMWRLHAGNEFPDIVAGIASMPGAQQLGAATAIAPKLAAAGRYDDLERLFALESNYYDKDQYAFSVRERALRSFIDTGDSRGDAFFRKVARDAADAAHRYDEAVNTARSLQVGHDIADSGALSNILPLMLYLDAPGFQDALTNDPEYKTQGQKRLCRIVEQTLTLIHRSTDVGAFDRVIKLCSKHEKQLYRIATGVIAAGRGIEAAEKFAASRKVELLTADGIKKEWKKIHGNFSSGFFSTFIFDAANILRDENAGLTDFFDFENGTMRRLDDLIHAARIANDAGFDHLAQLLGLLIVAQMQDSSPIDEGEPQAALYNFFEIQKPGMMFFLQTGIVVTLEEEEVVRFDASSMLKELRDWENKIPQDVFSRMTFLEALSDIAHRSGDQALMQQAVDVLLQWSWLDQERPAAEIILSILERAFDGVIRDRQEVLLRTQVEADRGGANNVLNIVAAGEWARAGQCRQAMERALQAELISDQIKAMGKILDATLPAYSARGQGHWLVAQLTKK